MSVTLATVGTQNSERGALSLQCSSFAGESGYAEDSKTLFLLLPHQVATTGRVAE